MHEALNTAGETVLTGLAVIGMIIVIGIVVNLLGMYLTRSSKRPYKR